MKRRLAILPAVSMQKQLCGERVWMNHKMIVKTGVDIGMTVVLLFLMAYEMIGQALHEWLGIGMFLLFVIHHILNRRWFEVLLKGKYTPFRIWQTVLVVSVLLSMIGSMVSGAIISRSVLSFLPIHGGSSFGRTLHMLSAYWGFVLMSLHLGLHWNMMLGVARKAGKATSTIRICILRIVASVAAVYGMYAFVKRDIGNYMLLKVHFVFFDYDEPLFLFLLDYMAVMGLFIFIGHYLAGFLKQHGRKKKA